MRNIIARIAATAAAAGIIALGASTAHALTVASDPWDNPAPSTISASDPWDSPAPSTMSDPWDSTTTGISASDPWD